MATPMLVLPNLTVKDQMRFWEKVDRKGPDDCWLWTAGCFGRNKECTCVR